MHDRSFLRVIFELGSFFDGVLRKLYNFFVMLFVVVILPHLRPGNDMPVWDIKATEVPKAVSSCVEGGPGF